MHVKGLFYGAPYYDVPALLAFLTILITTVNFVVSVEVNFYPKYRAYYALLNDGGTVKDIVVAEREMLAVLNRELYYTALKQLFVTAAVISLEKMVLGVLPLGFNDGMHGYFRVLCVGYALYAVGNTVLMILLYFTDYFGAVCCAAIFAGSATVLTVISQFVPVTLMGRLPAGRVGVPAGRGRAIGGVHRQSPYRVLGAQPIVATEKRGWFTKLGEALDEFGERLHGTFGRKES